MTRHLLSCSCGKTLAIEAGQAGETIRCSCGAELEVPSFREIRKLPLAVEPPTTKQSRQPVKWSLSRGLVFSIGLAIAVFGICMAGYFQWGRSRLSTEQSQWDNLEGDLAHIDTLDPIAMVDLWQMVKQVGLGNYNPPPHIVSRAWSGYWLMLVRIGLITAVVGSVLIGIAYLIPQPSAGRKRRPPARMP